MCSKEAPVGAVVERIVDAHGKALDGSPCGIFLHEKGARAKVFMKSRGMYFVKRRWHRKENDAWQMKEARWVRE